MFPALGFSAVLKSGHEQRIFVLRGQVESLIPSHKHFDLWYTEVFCFAMIVLCLRLLP